MPARKLKDLVIDRVDLCKLGANFDVKSGDGSHILLMKHATADDLDRAQQTAKVALDCPNCGKGIGLTYDDSYRTALPNYCPNCGAQIQLKSKGGEDMSKSSHLPNPSKDGRLNHGDASMPDMTPEAIQKAIDDAVAKAVTTATANLTAENAALKKSVEDQKAAADAAAALAKVEKDARVTNETKAILSVFKHLPIKLEGDGNDIAVFKTLTEKAPEVAERVHELLKAAEALLVASKVTPFKAVGKTNDGKDAEVGPEGGAFEKIQKAAEVLVTEGKVKTLAAGIAMVQQTQPELVKAYEAEFQAQRRKALA